MAREIPIPVAVARLLPDLIEVASRDDFPECAEIVLQDVAFDEPVPLARIRKGKPLAPNVPQVWVIQRPEHDDERDGICPAEFTVPENCTCGRHTDASTRTGGGDVDA